MASSIADQVSLCLEAFESLIALLSTSHHDTKVNFADELDRFKVWAGNIGAHRRGQSSLDYRLRDASHIRQRVLKLLSELQTSLAEARAVGSGERLPLEDLSDSDEESDGDSDYGLPPASELSHIGSYIRETIRCLLRLSMTIQNPAPHDRFMKGSSIDKSHFEVFDTQHVCSKFPNADDFVAQRLGKAISARRQFLKYSEDHRKRLKAGLSGNAEGETQSTVASSLPFQIKSGDFELVTKDNDDQISQTSFATSIANSDKLKVPPFPKSALYGQEFECPLCYCIVSVENWVGWKRHVFNDLQPYVCIVQNCKTPDRVFTSRRAWEDHLRQESGSLFGNNICPLCLVSLPSLQKWRSHVGGEMQQLALFAIPKEMFSSDEDDEDGNGESDDHNDESDDDSVLSKAAASPVLSDEPSRLDGKQPLQNDDGDSQRLLPNDPPLVSEPLLPIYNTLSTILKCLIEVKKSGGVSWPRELYPYSMKLKSIDSMRVNGQFVVGNEIPEGQNVVGLLVDHCYTLIDELTVQAEGISNASSPTKEQIKPLPLEIIDPETGNAFPKVLPASSFPETPDEEMVKWNETVSEKLRHETEPTQDPGQRDRDRDHEDHTAGESSDEWSQAAQYFSNPLYRDRAGRPAIVRPFSRPVARSPREFSQDRGRAVVSTVRHLWNPMNPPHSSSRIRRGSWQADDDIDGDGGAEPQEASELPPDFILSSAASEQIYPRPLHAQEPSELPPEFSPGDSVDFDRSVDIPSTGDSATSSNSGNERPQPQRDPSLVQEASTAVGGEHSTLDSIASEHASRTQKPKEPWTEVSKDLVLPEAIQQLGYEYEETEHFFYIKEYLKYEDVGKLVDISDRLRAAQSSQESRRRLLRTPLPPLPDPFRLKQSTVADDDEDIPERGSIDQQPILIEVPPDKRESSGQEGDSSSTTEIPEPRLRGILRKPTPRFPNDLSADRERVAPLRDRPAGADARPAGARWTKIDRRLVNPQALEEAGERFEERTDSVIVLRALTKEEIQKHADRTAEIREERNDPEYKRDSQKNYSDYESDTDEEFRQRIVQPRVARRERSRER